MNVFERWQRIESVDLYRRVLDRIALGGRAYDVGEILLDTGHPLATSEHLLGAPQVYRSLEATLFNPSIRARLSPRARATIPEFEQVFASANLAEVDQSWNAARGFTFLLTTAPGTPAKLLSVCRKASKKWKRLLSMGLEIGDAFESAVSGFRSPDVNIEAKLRLVERIDILLDHAYDKPLDRIAADWARHFILTSLLKRSFVWPLVVAGPNEEVAISVPIGLTVTYPEMGKHGYRGWPAIEVLGTSPEEATAWREAMHRGRVAAYWLWRVRHGYHGVDARRTKRAARISMDVSASTGMLRPLRDAGIFESWRVSDPEDHPLSSAESYFAAQIFGRHARLPLATATVVTGKIGAPRTPYAQPEETPAGSKTGPPRGDAGVRMTTDYELLPAGAVRQKLEYLHRTKVSARAILREWQPDDLPCPEEDLGFELAPVSTLQQAIRVAFGENATAQRYLRLPDEAERQMPRPGRNHVFILKAIRGSPQAVLQLSYSLSSILDALRLLDRRMRPALVDPLRTPPRFSWVAADLNGVGTEQAWSLLWEFCDGSSAELADFLRSRDGHERAERVAALLNRFADSARLQGLRAPDLLVLRLPLRQVKPDLESSNDIEDILTAANLRRSSDDRLDPFIGNVRVIIVRATDLVAGQSREHSPKLADAVLQNDFNAFRAFRMAVDGHTARRFLALVGGDESDGQTKARLGALVASGWLLKSGWSVCVEPSMRASTGSLDPLQAAHVHACAARSLVPILNVTTGLPTDMDRGHTADRLAEASWHAHQGDRILRAANNLDPATRQRLQATLDDILVTIHGALAPASWEGVRILTPRSPETATRVVQELVTDNSALLRLTVANRFTAAAAIWKSRRRPDVDERQATSLTNSLVESILADAPHSRPDNWIVAGQRALGAFDPSDTAWSALSEVVARGLVQVRRGWQAPPFHLSHRWAHNWAQHEPDHGLATARYEEMTWWVRLPIQLLIEQLGTMAMSRKPRHKRLVVIERIRELCGAEMDSWIRRVEKRSSSPSRGKHGARSTPSHAKERADVGIRVLRASLRESGVPQSQHAASGPS
jgi:hypothetical protein